MAKSKKINNRKIISGNIYGTNRRNTHSTYKDATVHCRTSRPYDYASVYAIKDFHQEKQLEGIKRKTEQGKKGKRIKVR